jgi:hypothetical protein
MADRGIIFSAPMVRALLDGRKTQTRRLIALPTKTHSGGPIYERPDMGGWQPTTNGGDGCFTVDKNGERLPVPETVGMWHRTTGTCLNVAHQVGDRLWVREAWRFQLEYEHLPGSELPQMRSLVEYDLEVRQHGSREAGRYRHARFMPRWASRLTLTATDVRVQRLQDISEADAIGEGSACLAVDDEGKFYEGVEGATYRCGYAGLWNTLHTTPGARWEDNPWIVAVSFDVEQRNIDQVLA